MRLPPAMKVTSIGSKKKAAHRHVTVNSAINNRKADLGEGTGASIYLISGVLSLMLSAWCAWADSVPNADGALYLRAAEFLARGDWYHARALYGWPFYSLVIAQIMTATGLNALLSAQIANAFFATIATLAFVGIANRLSGRDLLVAACAAAIVLLNPELA